MTPEQWLKRPDQYRVILVEANYVFNNEVKTLYLSSHAFTSKPSDTIANKPYKNWLNSASTLSFAQRMSTALRGKSTTGTSAIELFLHPEIEHLVTQADFTKQTIKVFIGDPLWARDDFIEKFSGLAKSFDPVSENRAKIVFSDYNDILAEPLLNATIASGANKDAFVPRCFGQCFNVEPVLINNITNTYAINDGAIHAVTQVRESGFIINSQNYTVDTASGTITITQAVTGRLTLDCKGHVENGVHLTSAEQIINYLLSIKGLASAIDSSVLPSYILGLYVREQKNINNCIDELCQSTGGNWYFDALSQFRLQQYSGIGTPTAAVGSGQIKSDSLTIKTRIAALKKLTLGYQKNYTPQGDSLAASITENSPELAALFKNNELLVSDNNTVANISAAIELSSSTLIVNLADAQTELARRLALRQIPKTIYTMETTIKKHALASTVTVTYPRYLSAGNNAVIVGQVHKLNNSTDTLEVLA